MGKQETFSKFGNLTEGKVFGRLRIPIFGKKKKENMEIQKIARKKLKIQTKIPSIRTALRGYDTPSVHHPIRQVYDTTWLNFTK